MTSKGDSTSSQSYYTVGKPTPRFLFRPNPHPRPVTRQPIHLKGVGSPPNNNNNVPPQLDGTRGKEKKRITKPICFRSLSSVPSHILGTSATPPSPHRNAWAQEPWGTAAGRLQWRSAKQQALLIGARLYPGRASKRIVPQRSTPQPNTMHDPIWGGGGKPERQRPARQVAETSPSLPHHKTQLRA